MQKILKSDTQVKQAVLLGLVDKQLEKTNGTLFLYMTTAARLLYAQNWQTVHTYSKGVDGQDGRT